MFHIYVGDVTEELGYAVKDEVLSRWTSWLRQAIKIEKAKRGL